MEWEYQSVYRIHKPGTPYESADDVLNDEGIDGWELVGVVVVSAVYETSAYEIFYLKRKRTGPIAPPTAAAKPA